MSNTYPVQFPCVSRVEGHSAASSAGLVRTPMGAGNTRQRRAFRNLPQLISLVFIIEQKELASWKSWANAFAWDGWFEIGLPGMHASAAQEDVTPTMVRFCSDLQEELLPVHRLWYWRIRVTAEYLPGAGDFVPVSDTWIIGGSAASPSADWVIGGTAASPAPDFTNPGTPAFPVVFV